MSRPQSPWVPVVRAKILAGEDPKTIAYDIGMTSSAVAKMISNMGDVRKQYVTTSEYLQILSQRKNSK